MGVLGAGIQEYRSAWTWNSGVLGPGMKVDLELEYRSTWSWNTGVLEAGIQEYLKLK